MLKLDRIGTTIAIENGRFTAQIRTEGYVSGVAGGTFVDKKTGADDRSFGLDIVDFLLEPGLDDGPEGEDTYRLDPLVHGNIPKRYVELPQICTQARRLEAEVFQGDGYAAVRQGYRYTRATRGRQAGSQWEQVLVFPEDTRYFFSMDRITSVNAVDELVLRIDLPGHLQHREGDCFEQIYLSYHGYIPNREFLRDFPPDGRFLYQRGAQHARRAVLQEGDRRTAPPPAPAGDRRPPGAPGLGADLQRPSGPVPQRMIRARQHRVNGRPGPWLAGMTLDPGIVSEAWCHQRGYVCFIQEIGGVAVEPGGGFSAAYIIGYFDSVAEMEAVYDQHAGARGIELDEGGWRLV